ncbi:MAG: TolC family protein [Flavobacteriales bacterium]|nr:TolC family protein [Flavobacteriales bacterium]
MIIGAENNPGLKARFAEYNASLEKVLQVGTLPDPSVSFGYFISPVETRVGPQRAKISASQMFPWFGTLDAKEDVMIQQAKAKYEAFEEAKSKLFFEIKSVYYNIYFVKKGIHITQENIAILTTFQQLALIKIETGKSSIVDEMRVEMEINELQNQLAYLQDSQFALEVKFNALLMSYPPILFLFRTNFGRMNYRHRNRHC